jgi:hypothetical protein
MENTIKGTHVYLMTIKSKTIPYRVFTTEDLLKEWIEERGFPIENLSVYRVPLNPTITHEEGLEMRRMDA